MTPSNGLDSIHASNKNILCVEDISLSLANHGAKRRKFRRP